MRRSQRIARMLKGGVNKYSAKRTTLDGITFDSKKEARRYTELKVLEHVRSIENLQLQPGFPVNINGHHICDYRADFMYWCNTTRIVVVEDVKGMRTPVYKLKKKMVEALYGFTITEV